MDIVQRLEELAAKIDKGVPYKNEIGDLLWLAANEIRRLRGERLGGSARASVMLARRMNGATYKEIGAAFGISATRVRVIVTKAAKLEGFSLDYKGNPIRPFQPMSKSEIQARVEEMFRYARFNA